MVFLGITSSLIYVEVLRVIDVVQTSGVVYPASGRRLSHRSHNEHFSALITASRREREREREREDFEDLNTLPCRVRVVFNLF